jgi:hypothetical protein
MACGLLNRGTAKCALDVSSPDVCWHWPNRAAEEQLSDVPEYEDEEVQFWDRARWAAAAAPGALALELE